MKTLKIAANKNHAFDKPVLLPAFLIQNIVLIV